VPLTGVAHVTLTPAFRHLPGQADIYNRRQNVYDVSTVEFPTTTVPTTGPMTVVGLSTSLPPIVTAIDRTQSLGRGWTFELVAGVDYSVSGNTITLLGGLATAPYLVIDVTLQIQKLHLVNDAVLYFGDEPIHDGDPVTDSENNVVLDDQGNVQALRRRRHGRQPRLRLARPPAASTSAARRCSPS